MIYHDSTLPGPPLPAPRRALGVALLAWGLGCAAAWPLWASVLRHSGLIAPATAALAWLYVWRLPRTRALAWQRRMAFAAFAICTFLVVAPIDVIRVNASDWRLPLSVAFAAFALGAALHASIETAPWERGLEGWRPLASGSALTACIGFGVVVLIAPADGWQRLGLGAVFGAVLFASAVRVAWRRSAGRMRARCPRCAGRGDWDAGERQECTRCGLALRFEWPFADTELVGNEPSRTAVPIDVRCASCGAATALAAPLDRCTSCGLVVRVECAWRG